MIDIREGGLDDPRVIALLRLHAETDISVTPPGSSHVLDAARLKAPDISFWSAWSGERLLGVGALKRLSEELGEVKSMHTAEIARRSGVGSAILSRIIDAAKAMGMTRVSLETGSFDFFAPARALYARHGFAECRPFGDYRSDPNSVFMTLEI